MRYLSLFVQSEGERFGLNSGERFVLYVRHIKKRKPLPGVWHELFMQYRMKFIQVPDHAFMEMRPHAVGHNIKPEGVASMLMAKLQRPEHRATKKLLLLVDDLNSMTDWDDWDVGEWAGE